MYSYAPNDPCRNSCVLYAGAVQKPGGRSVTYRLVAYDTRNSQTKTTILADLMIAGRIIFYFKYVIIGSKVKWQSVGRIYYRENEISYTSSLESFNL